MENLEQYVGRTVKGVRFESGKYKDVNYPLSMREFEGHEGVITSYNELGNYFKVSFKTPREDYWHYPVEMLLPQLEKDLIGYTINDEKYAKIIAELVGMSVSGLLRLSDDEVHFDVNSSVYNKVEEYDLLDKCTPVYKPVKVKLPKINGYEGDDMGDYIQYGCAKLLKSWFSKSDNRHIASITLDSGVIINKKQINEIHEYLLSKRK